MRKKTRKELKRLVANGDVNLALEELYHASLKTDQYHEVLLLMGNYNELANLELRGLLTIDDRIIRLNYLSLNVLKVIDKIFGYANESTNKLTQSNLNISYDGIFEIRNIVFETAIKLHYESIKDWAKLIAFKDIGSPKKTRDIYIELDIFISPRRNTHR